MRSTQYQLVRRLFLFLMILALTATACSTSSNSDDSNSSGQQPTAQPTVNEATTLRIVSGSENRPLEPIIQQYAQQNNITIQIKYLGSVDIKLLLETGTAIEYDAVWPANSLWITLGDTQNVVKHSESIMRSPVVLGLKKPIAEELGWVGREDIRVEEIVTAAESNDLKLMMTSATQSNSGASAYFGFLTALSGTTGALTSEQLNDPAVGEKVTQILSLIERSSSSSGFLKDLFISRYADFDGMFNYEAVVIEANQEQVPKGLDPLYAIYPVDGLAIADSPLAYVDKGNPAKETIFLGLQQYLLSDPIQQEILKAGRRVGAVGITPENADTNVFNPEWGIDVARVFTSIRFPNAAVIEQALDLYQSRFRKPSFTVYCIDYSGSMEGMGEQQLEQAMQTLLDQDLASGYFLQGTPNDITIVIAFNDAVITSWRVDGNEGNNLLQLYRDVRGLEVGGGTNIYSPVALALNMMAESPEDLQTRFPAIILMTDGRSNEGSLEEVRTALEQTELDVPVFGITFGDADRSQLEAIAELTSGTVYDGSTNLIDAFRNAKGNN